MHFLGGWDDVLAKKIDYGPQNHLLVYLGEKIKKLLSCQELNDFLVMSLELFKVKPHIRNTLGRRMCFMVGTRVY